MAITPSCRRKGNALVVLVLCVVLGMLSGCAGAAPDACASVTSPTPTLSDPATWTPGDGPVSIALDRRVYAPGAGVEARIVNMLSASISFRFREDCSVFALDQWVNAAWKQFPAPCYRGKGDENIGIVTLPMQPGWSFVVNSNLVAPDDVGTYRLDLGYAQATPLGARPASAVSLSFQVCDCGKCS